MLARDPMISGKVVLFSGPRSENETQFWPMKCKGQFPIGLLWNIFLSDKRQESCLLCTSSYIYSCTCSWEDIMPGTTATILPARKVQGLSEALNLTSQGYWPNVTGTTFLQTVRGRKSHLFRPLLDRHSDLQLKALLTGITRYDI